MTVDSAHTPIFGQQRDVVKCFSLRNRVDTDLAISFLRSRPRTYAVKTCQGQSFDASPETSFSIMSTGARENNAQADALIENEIRLHMAMRLQRGRIGAIPSLRTTQRSLPLGERVQLTKSDSLYRPIQLGGRGTRWALHRANEKSHRRQAIATTSSIPSPYHASTGLWCSPHYQLR